jgi:hypothetical protein
MNLARLRPRLPRRTRRRAEPRDDVVARIEALQQEVLEGDWFQTGYVLHELKRIENPRTGEPKRRATEAALQMRAAMIALQTELIAARRTDRVSLQLALATWSLVVATAGLVVVTLVVAR